MQIMMKKKKISMVNHKTKESKKSQSNIIAIVLIILLVLASIIIVWQFIQPMTKSYKDESLIRQDLMNVKMSISDVTGDLSYPIGNKIEVIVSSDPGSLNELSSVKSDITYHLRFVVYSDTNSYTYDSPESIDPLLTVETHTFSIDTGGVANIKKIEMILFADIGNGKEVTDLISTWTPESDD